MKSGEEGSNGKATTTAAENFLEYGGYHHHGRHFSTVVLQITVLFVVVGFSCLVLYHTAYPTQFFQSFYNPNPTSENSTTHDDAMQSNFSSPFQDSPSANLSSLGNENNLERVLNKAAMKDKTVIITTLNAAWTEPNSIFDLFVESFRIGNQTQDLLNHVVFVALDEKAYSRCLGLHPHCYALSTDGIDFSGEAFFMSEDYLKMMWRRIDFLRVVLEMGYNFIFSDADVMWLRNPFHQFHSDGDFQIACDHYWYNYTDLDNSPNGGFNYVKSNNKTKQFYRFWYESKDKFPGKA
ncbi:Nucleotide-diphospho-sugar transferase family protein [Abeliophyllum distichum]|uniref:Nucleotide-diphospho-sugar transferase family protein n=1 Tax=Abeliophyllum distichum TaxID=126358 RepID=A0ABD1Q7X3_9LAMI